MPNQNKPTTKPKPDEKSKSQPQDSAKSKPQGQQTKPDNKKR